MTLERTSASASVLETLDRVLDKGIVVDVWARVSLVGIDLLSIQARVVVASIETFSRYDEALTESASATPYVETWTIPMTITEDGTLRFTPHRATDRRFRRPPR